ncbi:MAG: sigma-54-dependent transcriptional regulator [Fusobacteriota bacterium]
MKSLAVRIKKNATKKLQKTFKKHDYEINFIDELEEMFNIIEDGNTDVVILDGDHYKYAELIEIIKKIKTASKKVIVLVIGERSSFKIVAGSIKNGAYDYILKPIDSVKIMKIAERAIKNQKIKSEKVKGENMILKEDKIIGTTKEMVNIYKLIGKVSESSITTLINGESGTGKELIAKAIHNFSANKNMPFVKMNCTSTTMKSFEKELFGYKTDEHNQKLSKFELAYGGTLFLEEVCNLDLEMQSKLLETIQKNTFHRIGDTKERKLNTRIIASSTKNLEDMIVEGTFRDDLYHRLKVVEFNLPPLRERKDDITLLINYWRNYFNDVLEKDIKGVSKSAMKKMMRYDWPGNISELKNAVKSAMAICRGDTILIEDLPANVIKAKIAKRHGDMQDWVLADWIEGEISILEQQDTDEPNYYNGVISRVEREVIRQTLEIANGKKVETARLLGITRNTLRSKMNKYGLE